MNTGSLLDLLSGMRIRRDVSNHLPNSRFELKRHPGSKRSPGVGGSLLDVGGRSDGEFNLHGRRNMANAASTSASLAVPLLSASSMARSSSCDALYTRVANAA